MGVSGNLKTMLPGDLLQWLSLGQKTGTLVLSKPPVEKKVFFRNGRVISSASNDPREYLGQFLMSHGYITEPELKKAMEVQLQSGILLGKILVMIEVIAENDLVRLMRLKAEEEIYDIFLWQEGEFIFLDEELPKMDMIPLQVDVTGIIMEGTRRVDEWRRIRELVPNDSFIPEIDKRMDIRSLDAARRIVVAAVDGKRSIAEIVLESRSSAFLVSETLHLLARDGACKLTDPSLRPGEEQLVAAPSEIDEEDDEIISMLARAQSALRKKEFEKALRLLKAAQNLDPNHEKVRAALRGAETVILSELHNEGITEAAIPKVSKPIEEITKMNFTPNEGFILSRVNGTWDIGSLIKISPIREADAMLIFYKLHRDGVIRFD
jgi:Domain of unknown function (DUF4388)